MRATQIGIQSTDSGTTLPNVALPFRDGCPEKYENQGNPAAL